MDVTGGGGDCGSCFGLICACKPQHCLCWVEGGKRGGGELRLDKLEGLATEPAGDCGTTKEPSQSRPRLSAASSIIFLLHPLIHGVIVIVVIVAIKALVLSLVLSLYPAIQRLDELPRL